MKEIAKIMKIASVVTKTLTITITLPIPKAGTTMKVMHKARTTTILPPIQLTGMEYTGT